MVEDNESFRRAIRALLESDRKLEIVGEASNANSVIAAIYRTLPDLVIMDLHMPGMNGIEATIQIKQLRPITRVLILTNQTAEPYVQASLRAGADAYILKDSAFAELKGALHTVLKGEVYISPEVCA